MDGNDNSGNQYNLRDNFNALQTEVTELRNQMQPVLNGDQLLSAPALAIGVVSAAEVKFDELRYRIDGVTYRIAAGEVGFTATTHDILDPDANPKEAIYDLSVAAGASAPVITKGTDAEAGLAVAPTTPAGAVKVGEVLLQHDGTLIFNASTDLLSAAHMTDTYTDQTPATLVLATQGSIQFDT